MIQLNGISSNVTLISLSFTNCSCVSGSGGGMYVNVTSSGVLNLERLTFTGCSASSVGGGVYCLLQSNTSVLQFSGCVFGGGESVNGGRVYIRCVDGPTSACVGNWISQWTSYSTIGADERMQYWVEETTSARTKLNSTLLHFLYNPSTDSSITTLYISRTGADISTCGWDDIPCVTLYSAMSVFTSTTSSSSLTTIALSQATHSSESTSVSMTRGVLIMGGELSSSGGYTTVKNVSSSSSPLLSITSSSVVTLTLINFVGTTSVTLTGTPLIEASEGKLKMVGVRFQTMKVTNTSLLSISATSSDSFRMEGATYGEGGSGELSVWMLLHSILLQQLMPVLMEQWRAM